METFVTDISSGLADDTDASTIADSAVDAVIGAVRSDMNLSRCVRFLGLALKGR